MAAIVVLNIFLGWTFLGWLAALIWSFTDNTRANSQPVRVEKVINPDDQKNNF